MAAARSLALSGLIKNGLKITATPFNPLKVASSTWSTAAATPITSSPPSQGGIRFYSNEKTATKEKSTENAAGSGKEQGDAAAANPEIEELNKQIIALKEQNGDLLDKYKRSLADSENMRKRLQKQIKDASLFGIQSFCKDLLEVADNLGHATNAVPKDKLTEQNPDLKNLYEGVTMTQATLLQVFKRHGVEPVNPVKEKFNPNFHEALFTKDDSSVEPNTVIEVTKLGYKLHERCIRPALVGVSK